MSMLTPFQTTGPFFEFALPFPDGGMLVTDQTEGERIVIDGVVLDGAGAPLPDAIIEIWQADSHGHYKHPDDEPGAAFNGFGRVSVNDEGQFSFTTIKPGRVPGPGGHLQAPHIGVSILGRGLLTRLVTRIYFPDEAANSSDAILALVPAARRATLIAAARGDHHYRLDLILQGVSETVFFDV
jgi:protocatechuate 3,4-dioxygenase, alpha subunit